MPKVQWQDFGNSTYALTGGSNIGAIVQRGEALLIDAGLDRDAARKALRPLESLHIDVVAILITHGHADHFGGAPWAARRTKAPIYAPPLARAYAAHPLLEPIFLNGGAAPFTELTSKFTLAKEAAENTQVLEAGRCEIEGIAVEVVELPGHSPSQVGIGYRSDEDGPSTFYCGDAVFPEETLQRHPILFCYDLDAWLQSLEQLPNLAYDHFIAGHGKPVQDIAPLAHATADRLCEIRQSVWEALEQPREPYEVLRALARHFDVVFTAPQYFLLSLTTVNAALTSLQRQGRATIGMDGNRLFWQRAD